jgi:hypothetical protein
MDPRDLRDLAEEAIRGEIEWKAWNRCAAIEKAERESLRHVLDGWKAGGPAEQSETRSKIVPGWWSPLV